MSMLKRAFEDLKLPEKYKEESNLAQLKSFCRQYVSQDVAYEGTPKEQYAQYYDYVRRFLDLFMPQWLALVPNSVEHVKLIREAARAGYNHVLSAPMLLNEKVVNIKDEFGMTPLHHAAVSGNETSVVALLNQGANPNILNAQDQLAIHSALWLPALRTPKLIDSKMKIVQILLPLTPDALRQKNLDGNTLFHLLAVHPFELLMQTLLQANPDIAFEKNKAGLFPIHMAILNGQLQVVELLMSKGGTAVSMDDKGAMPLHYAARYGQDKMIRACLSKDTDINAKDNMGRTALYWAAEAGNTNALTVLLERGAEVLIHDNQECNVLHAVIKAKHIEAAAFMLSRMPSTLLDEVDSQGHTPVYYAEKNEAMMTLLKKHNIDTRHIQSQRLS